MKTVKIIIAIIVPFSATVFFSPCNSAIAQAMTGTGIIEEPTRYRLSEGSLLTDECIICDRPAIPVPINGGFKLIPEEPDMYFENYRIENFNLQGSGWGDYRAHLEGTYRIGGHLAILQEMKLRGSINGKEGYVFESGLVQPQEKWPWIEIELRQVLPDPQENPLQVFSLYLVVVPWRQLWFSTEASFTSEHSGVGRASDGDLLSSVGRIVRHDGQLVRPFGIMPIVDDLGLDAVITPGRDGSGLAKPCEIWFSIKQDSYSETLGYLHEGDLLSDQGRIVRSYTDLVGAFTPMPPIPDAGLDAVSLSPDGMLLFSVREDFFSEKLGRTVTDGDLLKEDGTIFMTAAELMSAFEPEDEAAVKDIGLDGAIAWPNGEVWFSIDRGFTDRRWEAGHVGHGDLLSSNGRIVMRNLELLREFAPLEDLADFGLDALVVGDPFSPTDLDYDGNVDMADAAIFALWWQRSDCGECGGADLSLNADVGIEDLAMFADHWLSGGCQPLLRYEVGPCGGSTDTYPTGTRFSVKVQGRYIFFEDAVLANCCAKAIELRMTLVDGQIILDEIEHPGAPCDCICRYPISAILGPLEPGRIELIVYEHLEGGTFIVGSSELVIEP